jgi:glycosyltransferase involved in cell wall biosynthesis
VVLFYSDPWLQNNFLRWTPAMRQRCAHAEAEALRCASGVIFTNTATARAVLCNRTDRHLRHLVLPHVYLPELYASVSNDSKRRDVVFTYAGHFYGSRQPEKLFAALALMHREHPALAQRVRLQIVGPAAAFYKKQFDRYLQQLSGLGLATRVQLLGQRDYLSTLKILQASDVLINIDAEAEQSLYLPSKLIDYLGSEKPIWTISPPGPAYELVERYGGLATHATNVNEIMRDFARCVTRTLQQNWNLDCAFAGQFESWKVYPQLKSFLETLATEGQRTLSHRSIARGRSRAPVA